VSPVYYLKVHQKSQTLEITCVWLHKSWLDHVVTLKSLLPTAALYKPNREFFHFPKLRAVTTNDPSSAHFSHFRFVKVLEELRAEFKSRFKRCEWAHGDFQLIWKPLPLVYASSLTPTNTCSDFNFENVFCL